MIVSPQVSKKVNFKYVVLSLILLALLDSLFTDIGIRQHYITEANPIMKYIYDTSVFGFYALKISLPIFLLLLLSKIKPKKYLNGINKLCSHPLLCCTFPPYFLDFIGNNYLTNKAY